MRKLHKQIMSDFNALENKGTLYTTKQFIKEVKLEHKVSDLTGCGYLCKMINNRVTYQGYAHCNVRYLRKNKRKCPFVVWFIID